MADYNDIGTKWGIIYTCNCGWLDRAHSYALPNPDKTIGASNLWMKLLKEDGPPESSGPVGRNKNRRFEPVLHPCTECTTPPAFPAQFKVIVPAVKGIHFIDHSPLPNMAPVGY